MKNKLWIFKSQQIKLLQKIHDQSTNDHFDKNRIIEFIKRFYYWFRLKDIVVKYIRNCDFCQKNKTSRDKINDFLIFLLILKQRWRNIIMNFIIDFFSAKRYNVICIIINCLIKKRHYVFYWNDEQDFNAEKIAFIIIWNVFRLHELSDTIVSDRNFQFISMVWKHMCARLRIKINMSIAFYSFTNEQTERVNQNVKRHLRIFCNYAQDNWSKWLSLTKFNDNNNVFSFISMFFFYMNKDFHSRISFSSNISNYDSTRERIEAEKIDDIVNRMQKLLKFNQKYMKKIKSTMRKQINKYRKEMKYQIDDSVRLSSKNIKTTKLSKKLNDRMFDSFKIIEKMNVSYRLKLLSSMHQHDVFSLNYLRFVVNNSLLNQKQKLSKSIMIDDEKAWNVDDILNSRHHYGRLQYKVKWHELNCDNEWYYVDKNEFKHSQEIVDEFHKRYSKKSKLKSKSKSRKRSSKAWLKNSLNIFWFIEHCWTFIEHDHACFTFRDMRTCLFEEKNIVMILTDWLYQETLEQSDWLIFWTFQKCSENFDWLNIESTAENINFNQKADFLFINKPRSLYLAS